jgi:hypothetical protein
MGGGGNDVVKSTNINEIQILFAGYQKPAKTGKFSWQLARPGNEAILFGVQNNVTYFSMKTE